MKIQCAENVGETIEIEFFIPNQKEIDIGEEPEVTIDLSALTQEDHQNFDFPFIAPAFELLSENIKNKETADVVAEWLEGWAQDIREKFIA